ncbi:hypothetical protein RiCNE_00950 [Rickettsia endosymbiont of Culicoides newsteadi]|nr:hypothetical protein RiCNE_00950 [Rickettsia endosymbiont of Culicoides newsteadi]
MTSSLNARLLLIGVAPSFLAPNSPELTIAKMCRSYFVQNLISAYAGMTIYGLLRRPMVSSQWRLKLTHFSQLHLLGKSTSVIASHRRWRGNPFLITFLDYFVDLRYSRNNGFSIRPLA